MIGIIFLSIFFFLVFYLLVAPLYLEIDSDRGFFRIRFHHLAMAKLGLTSGSLMLDMKIIGWSKQIDLLARNNPKNAIVKEKMQSSKSAGLPFRKWWMVMKTFRVTTCDVSFDSGSMPLNGMLYPLIYGLGSLTHKHISVNFQNENKIVLVIQNNLARILWAFIISSITHNKNNRP